MMEEEKVLDELLQKIKLYKKTKDKRLQNAIIKESMVLVLM